MNILIDTHIFLWAVSDSRRLSESQKELLVDTSNSVFVSSISIAEIMVKSSIGKLKLPYDPVEAVRESRFMLLDFSAEDALRLKDLPFHHKDPFDRMLITQALERNCYVMSNDRYFSLYSGEGLRVVK